MRPKRTRVVPRLVLGASFIGVMPACAIEACGGQTTTANDGGGDAANETFLGVFACCFDSGVAVVGFDADADSPAEASDDGQPGDGAEGG